jgi:hypothetical protein
VALVHVDFDAAGPASILRLRGCAAAPFVFVHLTDELEQRAGVGLFLRRTVLAPQHRFRRQLIVFVQRPHLFRVGRAPRRRDEPAEEPL